MSKQDVIEVEGKVLEALPNAMFQVELDACFWKNQNELYQNFAWRQSYN